ncbi:MAG TPA: ABC transporter permease [Candidatus Angelobacter sp.]
MIWLRIFTARVLAMFRKQRLEGELDAELRSHIEMLMEENLQKGMSPEEARRAALRTFGWVDQVKEIYREQRGLPKLETVFQDLRYGLRMLAKGPVFTVVAVLTLGFGIGLNTTLFSVVNTVALKPVPVRDSGRIVRLERWFASNAHGANQYAFSYAEFRDFAEHNRVFSSLIATSFPIRMAASLPLDASATRATKALLGSPENATVQMVSENYFSELGAAPALGRSFRPDEGEVVGAAPVVVLSYPYWQTRFNADPLILGKLLKINDTAFTIIGVAPREFVGTGNPPVTPDFWTPLSMQAQVLPGQDWLNQPLDYEVQLLGYLAASVSMTQAQADASVLEHRFAQYHPNPDNRTITLTTQSVTFFGNTEDPRFKAIVVLLMTIVGMVLAIACANLANMLLAKASGRQREVAVRLALGASRGRLVRQLLTESVLLALLGGMAGVSFSLWGTRVLWLAAGQFAGSYSAFVTEIPPDGRVFCYTLLLSVGTGVLFGLSPALQSSRADLTTSLKDAGTAFGHRLDRSRLRGVLVAAQIAISTLFLIVAGLLARGLVRSQSVDPGFQVRAVYPMMLPSDNDPAKSNALRRQEIGRLEALPDIQNVALTDYVPLGGTWTTEVAVPDAKAAPGSTPTGTLARHISPSYFDTLGIPIVRGRNFTREEAQFGAELAIVSAALARQALPGEDALGKKIKLQTSRTEWSVFEVVGIAGDVRSANISRLDPAIVYLPTSSAKLYDYFALLRIAGDSRRAMMAIRSTLEQVDGRLRPGFLLASLEDGAVQEQILMARTFTLSAMFLAGVALALASIGVYGVMAFLVSQREKEVGIHMALGATRGNVLLLMLSQGMRPVVLGGVLGIVGALGISGLLRALLIFPGSVDVFYGARWFDPVTFIGLSCLLAAIALVACYLPARRATRVDPLVALRHE